MTESPPADDDNGWKAVIRTDTSAWMKLLTIPSATLMLLTVACATQQEPSLEDRTLPFGCSDTVVVGRVESEGYESAGVENDLLGHGWISANIRVRKVLKGERVPSVLPARYLAHANMRNDRDFMLVLRRTGGGYEIKTGQSMEVRPMLASSCE